MNISDQRIRIPHLLLIALMTAVGCQTTPETSGETTSTASEQEAKPEQNPVPDRPNVLWITVEDMDPDLGSYGDPYAHTPTLDKLAEKGVRYTNAYATAPICSPARSSLITGVWPNSLGTTHLRNKSVQIPEQIQEFPKRLRANGYYCTNNAKQDYNYDWPNNIWNETSTSAHWRNREDPEQPFFSVFNFTITHQSQLRSSSMSPSTRSRIRDLSEQARHDPADAPVPPYYPDTKKIRTDIATHYDTISAMDRQVNFILRQLKDNGLFDDTIIFFYSDHGRGMPRHKRWLYDSGMQVPLIVYFPEKYQHLAPAAPGEPVDRLVSFVDFPPTILSLLNVEIPDYMQGKPFLGEQQEEPRRYIHGSRDRVGEVLETSRSVRGQRYLYIRNYLPHRPSMPYNQYSEQTPTRKVLRQFAETGKLIGPARRFMLPHKPPEELYDTKADPYQVYNLADHPKYQQVLKRFRTEYRRWSKRVRDAALVPEPEMLRRARAKDMTVYEWRRSDDRFPLEKVLSAAEMVGRSPAPERVRDALQAEEPAVRYWAATACLPMGEAAQPLVDDLRKRFDDSSPVVRVAAAEAVAHLGHEDDALSVLTDALHHDQEWTQLYAANALRYLKERARPVLPDMRKVVNNVGGKEYLNHSLVDTISWLENGKPNLFGFSKPE